MNNRTPEVANSSALQLYHAAYRFHYESNDLKEACRLYREIIRHFPDSNESAYAVVQLEKIGAQEALKSLQNSAWQKVLPFLAILVSIFALLIAAAALLLVLDKKDLSFIDNTECIIYTIHIEPEYYNSPHIAFTLVEHYFNKEQIHDTGNNRNAPRPKGEYLYTM